MSKHLVPLTSLVLLAASPALAQPAQPPAPVAPATQLASPEDTPDSPLQLRIGGAYITPVGFMDFTGIWRNKETGSDIATNFGGIPYGGGYQDHTSESRFTSQNSRMGFRVDAMVHHAHVLAYMEADFLGASAANVAVSTNSNTLRERLYWLDVREGALELLAGQTWSLITPNRTGISPLPGDLFYTQNLDINYQAGIVTGRIPELRGVYHASTHLAFAVALDSPEQYIGGSSGGGLVTLPGSLSALAGTQLDNGAANLGVPNPAPDVIAKLAFDAGKRFHFEVGGVERQFRIWAPTTGATSTATGLGGFLNFNVEPFEGFRLLFNNYYSEGGGRYMLGQAPDVIVTAGGNLQTVQSGSTVDGLEWQLGKTLLFGYFGAAYIAQTTAPAMGAAACTSKMTCVGYGYPGSPASQNKWIEEESLGINQTVWKDAKYGAFNLIGQYAHVHRTPWSTPAGGNADAHLQEVFLDLRYTLPGSAPTLGH